MGSNFELRLNFAKQNAPSFQRYEQASYRVKDFTTINLNYTYYTIDQFFSNAFQLGIQYNLK